MGGKVLFTASTYSHVVNFHLAYLERFCREGWTAVSYTHLTLPTKLEV